MMQQIARYALMFLLLLAGTRSAFGVAEAKLPVSGIYETSKAVILGTITKVNAETGAVEANATKTIKGDGFTGPFRMVVTLEGLAPKLAADQPVVLMLSANNPKQAVLHLGDMWVQASVQAGTKLPLYGVRGTHQEFNHTYPGRTSAVVAIVQELKEKGKSSLIDKVEPRFFTGGINELGKLPVSGIKAVAAGDLDGDKKPEIVVATEQGVKVFSYGGKAFAPSKAAAPAGFPADAPKPIANAPEDQTGAALSSATGDFSESGQPARIVARPKGIFRQGAADADKSPTDDFKRLTGEPVATYPLGFDKGIDWAAMTAIDVNGDGKRDVAVLTASSGVLMINRGYGAFFVIGNLPKLIAGDDKPLPFKLGAGTFLAAADVDGDGREDLIVVNAEGQVWAVLNPQPK